MSKGDIISNNLVEYKDTYTGKKVTRLTTPDRVSHHPYFYFKMMTNDGKYLIYGTEIDGKRQICRMNLQDGKSVQLTEGRTEDFRETLTSDDKYMIFGKGDAYYKMDMETLKEELIYETEPDWDLRMFGLSSDDKFMIINQVNKNDLVDRKPGWSFFEPQWAKKPRSRLVYADVDNKTSKVIHEEKLWLNHAQIRPGDNNTILYCHEGPWNCIDARLWLMNADGSNIRCARPQHNEHVTHEFWLADGSKFAYVTSKTVDDNDTWGINFIDPATLKEEYLMNSSKLLHLFANQDCSLMVGDGGNPDKLFIYLIDVANKIETPLCYHGSSYKNYGHNQDCHPHPAFSPTGNYVVFSSDREGLPCIYKVDLD